MFIKSAYVKAIVFKRHGGLYSLKNRCEKCCITFYVGVKDDIWRIKMTKKEKLERAEILQKYKDKPEILIDILKLIKIERKDKK